jgi:hypothetical protein
MFRNRIARYAQASSAPVPELRDLPSAGAATAVVSLMMVPVATAQASWQSQLYQLAYARALADLAPPKHFDRFFSVWN